MTSAARAPRLLVFDWDGTLVDSAAGIVESANVAIAALGLPPVAEADIRNTIGLGLREALEALYPGCDDDVFQRFVDYYRNHFLREDRTPSRLFGGVEDTLRSLHSARYRLAVATGKSRRGLDRELDETGLAALFEASRCADETASKPDPTMLLELMDELAVEPQHTLMVGDTVYDLEMARSAGVNAVAVTYGVHEHERLLAMEPSGVLHRFADIRSFVLCP